MVTHKPNFAKSYYNRGNAYRDRVDFDKAVADYTKAVELNAGYAEAYYNRGKLYDEAGEYDKAIADFSAVIELEPEHADAYGYRGTLCTVMKVSMIKPLKILVWR